MPASGHSPAFKLQHTHGGTHVSITVITHSNASSGATESLESAFDQLELASRGEGGCISYEVFQTRTDSETPTGFMTHETYTDSAAYEAHQRTNHVLILGARIGPLLTHSNTYVLPAEDESRPEKGQVDHG